MLKIILDSKMSKNIVRPENIPPGTSWVYHLDAPEAILQCRVFGIEPSSTLASNRVLLCDFLTSLKINGGSLDPPENKCLEAFTSEDGSKPSDNLLNEAAASTATNSLLLGLEAPPPAAISSLPGGTPTHATPQQPIMKPIAALPCNMQNSTEPPWQQLVTATAAAVGESIARALATTNLGSRSRPNFDSCPGVLQDLVNRIPITSGSDPKKFVKFLIQVEKIRQLNLVDSHAFLVSLLPKTSNQLRTAWAKAVADNIPIQDLMQSLLGFFLPHRLRHSMVSDLLYRSQRPNEPLAEFISDLQDCHSLLMPELSQFELLEIALTGINQDTRLRLAGFPAPTSVDELMALAPRIEVVAQMHNLSVNSPPTPVDSQPNRQFNGRYNNDRQRNDFSQYRQQNRFQRNSQRGRGQAPFHRSQPTDSHSNPNPAPT